MYSSVYLYDKNLLRKQQTFKRDLAEVNANINIKCETLSNARRDVTQPPSGRPSTGLD